MKLIYDVKILPHTRLVIFLFLLLRIGTNKCRNNSHTKEKGCSRALVMTCNKKNWHKPHSLHCPQGFLFL